MKFFLEHITKRKNSLLNLNLRTNTSKKKLNIEFNTPEHCRTTPKKRCIGKKWANRRISNNSPVLFYCKPVAHLPPLLFQIYQIYRNYPRWEEESWRSQIPHCFPVVSDACPEPYRRWTSCAFQDQKRTAEYLVFN